MSQIYFHASLPLPLQVKDLGKETNPRLIWLARHVLRCDVSNVIDEEICTAPIEHIRFALFSIEIVSKKALPVLAKSCTNHSAPCEKFVVCSQHVPFLFSVLIDYCGTIVQYFSESDH